MFSNVAFFSSDITTLYRFYLIFLINSIAGFLANLAISLGLPTLVTTDPRSFQEYEDNLQIPGEEYPDSLYWEPSYEQELGRLQVYFFYLKVSDAVHQLRNNNFI